MPEDEPLETRLARERRELKPVLREIHADVVKYDAEDAKVFLQPVDVTLVPHYLNVIKDPIDLSIIGRKIEREAYRTVWDYMDDMWLMFENATTFNPPGTFHNRYSQRVSKFWMPRMERYIQTRLPHHQYCCGRRRRLSRLAYRCRGGTCFIRVSLWYTVVCVCANVCNLCPADVLPGSPQPPSAQHGSIYYYYDLDENDSIVFCHQHYSALPMDITMPRYGNGTGDEISFSKLELTRFVSSRLHTYTHCIHTSFSLSHSPTFLYDLGEPRTWMCAENFNNRAKHNAPHVLERFVECTRCKWKDHEICRRYNRYKQEDYMCCKCEKELGCESRIVCADPAEMPNTGLAQAIRDEIAFMVPEMADTICVRVVNVSKEVAELKPRVKERFVSDVGEGGGGRESV